MEEFKQVLESFAKDKSPRLDRWLVEFYLDFFFISLVRTMLEVIKEAHTSGKVNGVINATFLALILKCSKPLSFEEFHPISLCNLIYKVITKVVANKLQHVLSIFSLFNNLVSYQIDLFMRQWGWFTKPFIL